MLLLRRVAQIAKQRMVVYQRDVQIEAGYIDGMDKISILANAPANCNNGYSSSLGATNPTCNNGTWNGSCDANIGKASYRSCTRESRGGCDCRTVSNSFTTGQKIEKQYIYDSRCYGNQGYLTVTVTCENNKCSYP